MKLIARFFLVFAFMASAVSAHASCADWSKTASSNATADPTINWSVGMAPSAVSASGRAMMARLAECRDDLSGSLTTGGTSTAYTLTTNQGIANPPKNGQALAFTAHATNGTAATLAVDGGTAYPLQTASGTAASAAILIAGTPYTVKFNNSASAWVLHGFYGAPFSVPLGAMLPYTGASAPNSNFVLPAGQCISRTTYATYFALVGTTYGGCDGSTTFAVPDMRGRTIAALDNLGGSAANRLTSTYYGASTTTLGTAGGSQSQTMVQANLPSINFTVTIPAGEGNHSHPTGSNGFGLLTANSSANVGGGGIFGVGGPAGTSAATLPEMRGTAASGGSGTPISTVMPAIVISYILRVL